MAGGGAGLTAAGHVVHEVQFYGDDGELAASVADFLDGGLAVGCPAVVVATPAHRAAFAASLGTRADGVMMVDAATMLAGFLAGDRLDRARFGEAAAGLIGRAAAGTGRPVRIYAEMVALLWDAGQVTLALELEELWNGLAADLPFALLCGYPARLLAQPGEGEALDEVCRLHSGVTGRHPSGVGTAGGDSAGVVREFPPEPQSQRLARRFVLDYVGSRAGGSAAADAEIISGELAANAVLHARSAFTVAISAQRDGIRIAVGDTAPLTGGLPWPVRPAHGLDVVARLATRWAAQPRPGGKVVWADLPVPPRPGNGGQQGASGSADDSRSRPAEAGT